MIFLEYAMDVADACHERGIRAVAVSAGYMCPPARHDLYAHMDAANIDLKAFTETFYEKVALGRLEPVLDTLRYLRHDTDVWLEITTLLIPGHNDDDTEIDALTRWVADELGPDVPLHFSAFHPSFKMTDVPCTPRATLARARHNCARAGRRWRRLARSRPGRPMSRSVRCRGTSDLTFGERPHIATRHPPFTSDQQSASPWVTCRLTLMREYTWSTTTKTILSWWAIHFTAGPMRRDTSDLQ